MNSFKEIKKKSIKTNKSTIEYKHNKFMEGFENDKKNVHNFEKELSKLKKNIQEMDDQFIEKDESKYREIKERIIKLEDNIYDINNDISKNEYMLKVMNILEKYENSINKSKLYNEYLNAIGDYSEMNLKILHNELYKCEECHEENNEHFYYNAVTCDITCDKCGYSKFSNETITPVDITWEQESEANSRFRYKRINRLNECISQIQGNELTSIPDKVYSLILMEIKKERVKNLEELNYIKIKEYMKKLKLNKYYEHIPFIMNKLCGIKPPELSRELKEKLKNMFAEIQDPFEKFCPENRSNFLSYNYVLYQMCKLLEQDDLLIFFPLLKGRDKLSEQDQIWKKICKELKWEFIKTV
jgi:hypothetical protein